MCGGDLTSKETSCSASPAKSVSFRPGALTPAAPLSLGLAVRAAGGHHDVPRACACAVHGGCLRLVGRRRGGDAAGAPTAADGADCDGHIIRERGGAVEQCGGGGVG